MPAGPHLIFESYRLEPHNERLWQGDRVIPLTAKAFAVLCYLVEHTGQLVTKGELFTTLWPGTAVSDGALTFCIAELRKALGDAAKAPHFIETVHRRGYRFIAKVVSSQHPVAGREEATQKAKVENDFLAPNPQPLAPFVVGREADLAFLQHRLRKALNGERQIVFVAGEAGIGKTTLLNAFLEGFRN